MPPKTIRPIAICVFQDNGRILVAEAFDSKKNQVFYRPLGGTIEFGEHSRDTIRREMREEINAEVTDLRYLGTLENIFIHEGQPGHEIVQVYDGRLVDQSLYMQETIEGYETDIHESFKVVWKPFGDFVPGKPPVYPDGLLELLETVQK
jgi:8-oxo-dGTP pyrophosphatase MutT (NUDIX family)